MNKQEKLDKLDGLVLDRMLDILGEEDGELRDLGDLNTAIQYLAKNNVIEGKKQEDSVEDKVKKQLKAAEKRRAEGKPE